MAQQIIDVGNVANDGTGDPLRTAFQIVNDNFTEVYNPSSIANGSSRIDIAEDGDIYMTSNGVANVVVVSSTQVTITGDLAVTGNAILSGNIIGDRIQNGNTIIDIQSAGGNANVSVGGISNVAVFSTTGEYITGLLSVSGNVIGNNLNATNLVSTTGNVVAGNILTVGIVSATGNISGGNVSATKISGTSVVATTISATGNVIGGNITSTGEVSTSGNVIAGNISTSGIFSASSYSSSGNVTAGNVLTSGVVSAAGNATFANLTIGSGSTGNAIIYGNLTVYGNTTTIESNTITTNDLNITVGNNQNTGTALNNAGIDVGNNNLATWRFNNATTSWQSNIAITPSANATLDLGGTSNYWSTAYVSNASVAGTVYASTLNATGNVSSGNITTTGIISASGNITGGTVIATNIGNVAALNLDGNVANVLLGDGTFGNTPSTLGALNYSQNSLSTTTTVTTTDSFPYTILSTTLTTGGNPVQVIVTGDVNPLAAGNGKVQLYRDSTAIGQPVTYEASAADENNPYALQIIDTPSFGTYTYALKVVSLTANSQFGETNGPVLSAIEIQNVRGANGAPYAWRTVSANGTSITSNVSEGTITYTPGNNIVITGNATSNVVTFAVSDSPSFIGNVTGSNINGNLFSTTASVSGNATIGNANIGAYTTNALRVNGTGYIINSATTDPYPNTGTLDVAAVTQPNVVVRAFDQTTSNTSGPVVQFVRKQQTGTALSSDLDAGRMKFWAIQPNNDIYNYIGEVAGITSGSGTDGKLEFYTGLANVPQLVLTLASNKQANFAGAISASGNITGSYILGNGSQLTGLPAGYANSNAVSYGETGWAGNIVPSANVTYSLGNSTNWWSAAYFGASTVYIGGVPLGASGGTLNINGNNIVTANATGTSTTTGNVSITGNITSGNISASTLTGTLSTASQTNITSVGTLGSLSVTGNITGGNVAVGIASVDSITKTGSNSVGNIGSASNYFNYVFATATTALYADLAENYLADKDYDPGTVLSFGGSEEVTASSQDEDQRIIGIVSTKPSYIMNAGLIGEHVVTVALQGRTPCLVQGQVRRGDMMVSAGNGRARAENSPRVGTVIGKSLEDFDGDTGVIEVVVGRI